MNRLLKVISLLLTYPEAELLAGLGELRQVLADETTGGARERALLTRIVDGLARLDLIEAQERYVHLFDRTRTLSLHLFEHVHGESRERGQAMVDLMDTYEQAGFVIDAKELPDYLPLFLEFLSTRTTEEIRDLLGQTAHIHSALAERLGKRDSIYANAFVTLGMLAGERPDKALLKQLMDMPDIDPDDLGALDKIWEEEVVTFGGNAGENACGPDRLRSQLRAAGRKPADPPAPAMHA
jgi:nitrate reductase delta subunit